MSLPAHEFQGSLQSAIQDGLVESKFLSGLETNLAYAKEALPHPVGAGQGERVILTRAGRKKPVTKPISASQINSNAMNGITPTSFPVEQFEMCLEWYADAAPVNLAQAQLGVKDQIAHSAENNGIQAMQSLDLIARNKILDKYMGGDTFAIGSSTTTTIQVNDARGFEYKLTNGAIKPVTGANKLKCYEISKTTGAIVQELMVSGVEYDHADIDNVANVSISKGANAISGVLTFDTATAPTVGNVIRASNASTIFRGGGKLATNLLTGADILTVDMILDAVTQLRKNGVQPFSNGLFRWIGSESSMRQLLSDQSFREQTKSQFGSRELRGARILEAYGVEFETTNDAPVQDAADGVPSVQRAMVMGAGCVLKSKYKGVDQWLAELRGMNADGEVVTVDDIALIANPPQDLLRQNAHFSWSWLGDFACGSDLETQHILSASKAMHKRNIILEHAG